MTLRAATLFPAACVAPQPWSLARAAVLLRLRRGFGILREETARSFPSCGTGAREKMKHLWSDDIAMQLLINVFLPSPFLWLVISSLFLPFAQAAPFDLRPGTEGELVPSVESPSLIPNAEFSEGLQHWTQSQDDDVQARVDVTSLPEGRFAGQAALRMQKQSGIGVVRLVSDRIAVDPDTEYVLTGLYHTIDAKFGSLAEWKLLEITDPSQAEAEDVGAEAITGPRQTSITGHSLVLNSRPDQWRRKTRVFRTGSKTHFVRLALLLEGPPTTIWIDNLYLNRPEEETRRLDAPVLETVLSRQETEQILAARPDSRAEVKQENGGPRLYLDGQPRPPLVHLSDAVKPVRGYVREFADAGANLHMISLFNTTLKHWTGPGQYDLEKVDEVIWNSVQRDPKGYFILQIHVSPYLDWHEKYPEDVAMTIEGQSATSRHGRQAPASYYSLEYRRQVADLLRTYVQHIRGQAYAKAIVGFMLTGGEDGQFYYQTGRAGHTVQDGQSPCDLPLFRDWLRRRYPTVEALQTAWKDSEVNFETALPTISNRKYAGLFFNPKTQTRDMDVLRFMNDGVAEFLVEGLTICKREMQKPVLGVAYYGRVMAGMVYPLFSENSVIFHSEAMDLMGAQPGYYGWREPGNDGLLSWAFDSTRRHRKIPMVEIDFRTFVSPYKSLWHDFQMARTWNPEDFTAVMARDVGKALSIGGGAWWMEMTGGWYHEPEIMKAIQKVQTAGQKIAAEPNAWYKSKVAFVVDDESYYLTTQQINANAGGPNYHSLAIQQRALDRSGVAYDLIYVDDLLADARDDYSVYIFLNQYGVSKKLRQFVETRLKRDDKVLVWQYAPGYITDEGESISSMAALTGMRFAPQVLDGSAGLASTFAAPVAAESETVLAGMEGENMGFGVDLQAPRFAVEDGETQTLATYRSDGAVSAALKKWDGYTSIYIAHPSGLSPRLIQNLARLGGVHPYMEPGDMSFFHRGNFIVIHGIEGGEKTLRLPFRATVTEMLSNRVLAKDTDTLPLHIQVADTLWLHLAR